MLGGFDPYDTAPFRLSPEESDRVNEILTRTKWSRVVRREFDERHGYQPIVEVLDMEAAVKRLHDVMTERPDASLYCWLDVALNGWPDDQAPIE
jgi:hypothetical protein